MKYEKNDDSEEDYFAFVHWLEKETANELKQANGNVLAIRAAIHRYLERGYQAHLTSGELVDFFCVSTPCILHMAEFSDDEFDAVVTLYDEINPELFAKYYPLNP